MEKIPVVIFSQIELFREILLKVNIFYVYNEGVLYVLEKGGKF